ncbi:unnamed protein product [Symbiodinium microadriaticum]|nr:unnamed protein product [Symbiodinium microadriaticum]
MALRLSAENLAALEAEDPAVASPLAATPPTSPPGSFVLKKDLGSFKDVDVDADVSTAPSSPLLMEAKTPSAMPWWWRVVPQQEPRQGETERALAALRAMKQQRLDERRWRAAYMACNLPAPKPKTGFGAVECGPRAAQCLQNQVLPGQRVAAPRFRATSASKAAKSAVFARGVESVPRGGAFRRPIPKAASRPAWR